MCGPSQQQEQISGSQQSFMDSLMSNYSEAFANQQSILNQINQSAGALVAGGPDQQGFGPQELAALNTQADEGVGTNYAKASRALNNQLAAQGGGNEYLPSGAAASLKGNLATAAANQASNEQLAITNANYTRGRQNYLAGLNALSGSAALENPTGTAGAANNASENAFGSASQIQTMRNQEQASIAGGLTALATGIPGIAGGISAGISALSPNSDTSLLDAISQV